MSASTRRSDDFEDECRRHFEQLSEREGSFEQMLPVYRFGRDLATAPDTTGKHFEAIESTIRARFEVQHPDRSYERARQAIRYGYERAMALKPGASDSTLGQAGEPLQEWHRTLFQHGESDTTNVTSQNMAARDPQQDTSEDRAS